MVLAFPLELQKKLLHFATGSDRVPVGGMADLNFKISKIDVPTDWWVQKLRPELSQASDKFKLN